MLALKDHIAISNGSACTSQSYQPSHVLKAMALPEERAPRGRSASPGPFLARTRIGYRWHGTPESNHVTRQSDWSGSPTRIWAYDFVHFSRARQAPSDDLVGDEQVPLRRSVRVAPRHATVISAPSGPTGARRAARLL